MKEKCLMCKKRYTRPAAWKSFEENKYCFSCYTFLTYCDGIEKSLTKELHRLGLKSSMVEIFFTNDDINAIKLLESIYGKTYHKKFLNGSSPLTRPGEVSL